MRNYPKTSTKNSDHLHSSSVREMQNTLINEIPLDQEQIKITSTTSTVSSCTSNNDKNMPLKLLTYPTTKNNNVGAPPTKDNNVTTTTIRKQFTPISDISNASFSSSSVAGSIQDENMSSECSLTQAGLEEYNIRSSSYYDQPVMFHHQKQSSYAQSEGYHSYVSSSDSSSATPFLDRLRQESELLSRQSQHWSENDLSSITSNSIAASPTPTTGDKILENGGKISATADSAVAGDGAASIGERQRVNNSSESTSSTETLKWLGSMSDVSEASHATGFSAISESVSTSQLVVHSSRVRTPKRHHSESVLYLNDEQQQHQQQQHIQQISSTLSLRGGSPLSVASSSSTSSPSCPMHRHSPSYPPLTSKMTVAPHHSHSSLLLMHPTYIPGSLSPSQQQNAKAKFNIPLSISATADGSVSLTKSNCETMSAVCTTTAATNVIENASTTTATTIDTSSSSPACNSSYRNNHRLFPVSTYTEPLQSSSSSQLLHPQPQFSSGLKQIARGQTPHAQHSPQANGHPMQQQQQQNSWQSVAERINDFERQQNNIHHQEPHDNNGQFTATVAGQKYTFIDPSKTHRVSNPALKAFQKNAVQSYFERQQQQKQQQQRSKDITKESYQYSQQQLQSHNISLSGNLLRPHSFQPTGSAKEVTTSHMIRNSLPNSFGASANKLIPLLRSGATGSNGAQMTTTQLQQQQKQQQQQHKNQNHFQQMTDDISKAAFAVDCESSSSSSSLTTDSISPPPPPPRSRSLMPTLLRRSSSASDYADFRDQFVCATKEKLQAQSVKNVTNPEKLSFNDCGMPPPPPPPRGRASLSTRRVSSANEYTAMREKALQIVASSRHQNFPAAQPIIMGQTIAIDHWVPERPPKNPNLRIPSPDLPPPPAVDVVGTSSLSDEPLPPPPPEILHHHHDAQDAINVVSDLLTSKPLSPNRRNSFAGSSMRKAFIRASIEQSLHSVSPPPSIPKKPSSLDILQSSRPASSIAQQSNKAHKVILNGGGGNNHIPNNLSSGSNNAIGKISTTSRKRFHNPTASLCPPIMENSIVTAGSSGGSSSSNSNDSKVISKNDIKTPPPPPLMPRMSITNQGTSIAINSKLRCNSKASYLPRQSLDKLNTTDPDHGSYKLTLTSNEDCVSQQHYGSGGGGINGSGKNITTTTTKVYDIMVNGVGAGGGGGGGVGVKISNNLPDVLPVGAKLHQQQQNTSSPTTSLTNSPLRYGSNNSLPSALSQTSSLCYPPTSPLSTSPRTGMKHLHSQSRHSSPLMSNYSSVGSVMTQNNYNRSQSFDVGGSLSSPIKFMSQSAVDLKKTQILEASSHEEQERMQISSSPKLLSPVHSENNVITFAAAANRQQQSSSNTSHSPLSVCRDSHRNDINHKVSPVDRVASAATATTTVSAAAVGPDEGRIVRAELVNTHLSTSPISGIPNSRQQVVRKNSLRENIEKITQLQSKLMSAHIAESGLLGYPCSLTKPPKEATSLSSPVASQISKAETSNTDTSDDISIKSNDSLSSPPALPTPPSLQSNDKVETISLTNSTTDCLKLMQRSEIILRVNPPATMEVASQTDEISDSDNSSLSSSLLQSGKDDALRRTTLQPRQVHPIEVDCDNMSKDLANMLPSTDKLVQILVPRIIKSSSDYVCNLYNPNVPLRPAKRDVGTSTLMRMNIRKSTKDNTSPVIGENGSSGVEIEMQTSAMINGGYPSTDGCDVIKWKVEELIRNLNLKLNYLNTEQAMIGEETTINDELGSSLAKKFVEKIRPIDATKFRTYIDDVGHITSLLLSLSGRLAKAENMLGAIVNQSNSQQELKLMEAKRDRLAEQLEEAKRLKEDIDRRGLIVSRILENNLSADEYADYDFFVNMKAKLIADARDISDKIIWAEEQVTALSEALIQTDC